MGPTRTSAPPDSIWRDLPEDTFREHLVALQEQTNAIIVDSQTFSAEEWLARQAPQFDKSDKLLPLSVEQQVADDVAFLAAIEEGAQSVAATALEQYSPLSIDTDSCPTLVFRIAAVDSLNPSVRMFLRNLCDRLQAVASTAASQNPSLPDKTPLETHAETLFSLVIEQHYIRILGRLRSIHWTKPTHLARSHKKPLWQDFDNLLHRARHVYPSKSQSSLRQSIESAITNLQQIYLSFEDTIPCIGDDDKRQQKQLELIARIHNLITATHTFCHNSSIRLYARALTTLQTKTPQISAALKTLHQLEKIGAYLRIARSLIDTAAKYPTLFGTVEVAYLDGYDSVPTEIAYESWAKTLHVHAEIQLAVFYDLCWQTRDTIGTDTSAATAAGIAKTEPAKMLPTSPRRTSSRSMIPPRAIGTSKRLCYLCHLFLTQHALSLPLTSSTRTPPRFFPSSTHGRLYDQWTIPDLAVYSPATVLRYRAIVAAMDGAVSGLIVDGNGNGNGEVSGTEEKRGRARKRIEPMTSRQNLLGVE